MNKWRGKTLVERFWSHVNKLGPTVRPRLGRCWVWPTVRRYGSIYAHGKRQQTSRVAWFLATGKWPTLNILHKCDNGRCVRFSHLFEGTQGENVADMLRKGRKVSNPLRGEAVVTSKLTKEKVQSIRTLYANGCNQRSLAERFKVSQSSISKIVRRVTWIE